MAILCPLTATLVFLGAYCAVIYRRFNIIQHNDPLYLQENADNSEIKNETRTVRRQI